MTCDADVGGEIGALAGGTGNGRAWLTPDAIGSNTLFGTYKQTGTRGAGACFVPSDSFVIVVGRADGKGSALGIKVSLQRFHWRGVGLLIAIGPPLPSTSI